MFDLQYGKTYFDWFEGGIADPGIHFGIADAVHKAFPDVDRVLEVGCGRGYITQHLHNLYPSVVGLDISSYAVANPVSPDIRLIYGDVCSNLPLDDGSFDLVLSWQLLEHVNSEYEARNAASEVSRVCDFIQVHSICMDEESVKRDPSHHMIRPRSWWRKLFGDLGWVIDPAYQNLLERAGSWIGNHELLVLRRR